MSDEMQSKPEEVVVTRATDQTSLSKQSAAFISSLTSTSTLPTDPEEQVDELTRRMKRFIGANLGLSRKQRAEMTQNLSAMVVKAQTLSLAASTRHVENLLLVTEDARKRQLIGLWLEFIKKEGAKIIAGLNTFASDWQTYCQNETTKADNSSLTPDRKKKLKEFITQNEDVMLDDIRDMLSRFRQQNKEQRAKVEIAMK